MKRIAALLLALVMLLSLAACKTNTGNETQPTGSAESTGNSGETTPESTGDAQGNDSNIVTGGEAVIGLELDLTNYAAWRLRSNQEKVILSAIYEPLIRINENGELTPYLAESLEADSQKLTYTVTLRDGVTFSDGSKLDADVLLWNFENFKENSQTSSTHFGDVDSFEKIDDKTVVIHLKEWNTQIPYSLNSCAGMMYSKKAFDEHGYDWCLENPVGTGPYVMTENVQDDYKVLVKNENYWDKDAEPTFDSLRFKVIADEMSAQAALTAGDLDAYFGSSFAMRNTMSAQGFNVTTNKMWYTIFFLIYGSDVEGSPLCDVRVRQAIAYAIDSETIAQTVDYGQSFVSNQYAVEGTPFYSDGVKGYGYDVEKAKALLADAGYPNGFKTKISVGGDPTLSRYMVALQGYLKEVGIEVELDYQEVALWVSKGIYETDEGMILAMHGFGANLVNQAVSNFSKRAIEGVGMLKNSKIHPDDLDEVLMKALRATSEDEMLENMHTAEELIIDKYCLGYPIVMAPSQCVITAPDMVDDNFVNGNNEYPVWNNLYRISK